MEEIRILQKRLIRRARRHGVPTVVATQMLESMQHSEQPTRAEATTARTPCSTAPTR